MRQHAIPQNVLDVEFKLFTKFTLKEFAYLAIGIGFGGIMIYLTVSEIIPGILGIPIFIISSGAGIFLGLVPINDQDADKFIQSYITAITTPTQRAWLSKQMKEDRNKPALKPNEDGKLVSKDSREAKPKIIGGGMIQSITPSETTEEETADTQMIEEKPISSIDPSKILITDENRSNYQFTIKSVEQLPGNINIWLATKDFKPIPNVIVYLKTKEGKMLYANKTGPNGYFLTNKMWELGEYVLDFQHPQFKFPTVEIVLTNVGDKLPIKINSM